MARGLEMVKAYGKVCSVIEAYGGKATPLWRAIHAPKPNLLRDIDDEVWMRQKSRRHKQHARRPLE